MKCWKCQKDLAENQRFCDACGAEQKYAQTEQPPVPPPAQPGSGGQSKKDMELVLKIFAAVCALVYGIKALMNLFYALRWITLYYVGIGRVILGFLFCGALAVAGIWMCVILVLTALKRTPKNSDTLLLGLCAGGAAIVIIRIIYYPSFQKIVLSLLGAIITIGGVYLIRRFLLGEEPLKGKDVDELKREAVDSFSSFQGGTDETGGQSAQAAPQGAPVPPPPPPSGGPCRMKTDRSLVTYILLSIITCGIYGYYFLYAMARDANVICSADGKKTGGLVAFILLSWITCGLYAYYWYYSLGNRLAENAPRYGLSFQENGTTVLLWCLVGLLLCGLGPWIAMHILIKNMNSLCMAYNQKYGL